VVYARRNCAGDYGEREIERAGTLVRAHARARALASGKLAHEGEVHEDNHPVDGEVLSVSEG
jgi:hypothetical protein